VCVGGGREGGKATSTLAHLTDDATPVPSLTYLNKSLTEVLVLLC
jgi:hypothetical protein